MKNFVVSYALWNEYFLFPLPLVKHFWIFHAHSDFILERNKVTDALEGLENSARWYRTA